MFSQQQLICQTIVTLDTYRCNPELIYSAAHTCMLAAAVGRPIPCSLRPSGATLNCFSETHMCMQHLVCHTPGKPWSSGSTLHFFCNTHMCVLAAATGGPTFVTRDPGHPVLTHPAARACSQQRLIGQALVPLDFGVQA